ncbi:enoyl-CoA hydratase/isomerase family protein [Acuticoccus mangrovi]|uniref:Enoyl-CoA hydratase/isomerase family protein n=1 Tax=Acuticoccus mangrovi TaxID=2796142 RepID=A0A934MGA5_9HYPH|nr:enoyl-CoA hydratase/isomerase family protein [Acuticoccus mangrovi]MBJ3775750.1 enoyl-CoA hydratase/isomerase family protein [Acuticoccus mangrovi]
MDAPLAITRGEGWARLTLQRSKKRNALNRALRLALIDALEALEGQARAIVIDAEGPAFCAGLDLKEREADKAAGNMTGADEEWRRLVLALRGHPAVLIAAVEGMAIGAGMTLVNVADLAIAHRDATFALPEARLGSYASLSGPTSQPELTRKQAAFLLLSDERLDAATACGWGLVNEVRDDGVVARAEQLAARVAGYDPAVVTAIKRALDAAPGAERNLAASLAFGREVNRALRRTTDAADRALAAFASGTARS